MNLRGILMHGALVTLFLALLLSPFAIALGQWPIPEELQTQVRAKWGQQERAFDTLVDLDEPDDLSQLGDFLNYAYFDARLFPNLLELLEAQGIEAREPREIPYRCKI